MHVGSLRLGALAAASPVLQDAVVAGENREFIGLLGWLNGAGCHKLIGGQAPLAELASHPGIRGHVERGVGTLEWRPSRLLAANRTGAAAS